MSAAKKKQSEAATVVEDIVPGMMDDLMGERFNIYAKDVITNRAIPDARDGLKPVQRRIIFAMWKTGNTIDKPTKKCAHIVGEVMGKYHPHGDSSIYEALVHLSQPWSTRYPLVDFQGNNGSIDGDGPAAYRYTEARLAAIAQELVRDIDKEAVDMGLTFDDTEKEPIVLPAHFPNLLVNGTSGIAVGMQTNIPPHNLREVASAICHRIHHPNCPIEALMKFVPGPDFPTGGTIYESEGLKSVYLTGRGRFEMDSAASIGQSEDGVPQIVVSEIPFGINKSVIVGEIDKIRHDKTIDGILEVRDESDKTGVRIAVDLSKNAKPEAILEFLRKKTDLRSSMTVNMLAISNGRPVTLNLLSYCDVFIAHQKDVVLRRSKFLLKKNEARLEIVDGLIKAASIINIVIETIRRSADKADAKINLMAKFSFTDPQADAILLMPLYKLSHTDIDVLNAEHNSLTLEIAGLNEIVHSEDRLDQVIIEELKAVAKNFGDDRKTKITSEEEGAREINATDLIAQENVYVAVTFDGYIKRSSPASFKGSKGDQGVLPGMKESDSLTYSGLCDTHDTMLLFTTKGQYILLPVFKIKSNKWLEEGVHVSAYVNGLAPEEKIVDAMAVSSFREDLNIVLASHKGQIKRMKLSDFPASRTNRTIRCMKLLTDDEVVNAILTSGNSDLFVASENGLAVFYNENLIPLQSSMSSGVKAASFKGAALAGAAAFNPGENGKVLLVTDLAHVRVYGLSNIARTDRLGKATILYKMFKSETHRLISVEKADDRVAPFTYLGHLTNGEKLDVVVEDLHLTPLDKYAKKTVSLPKGERLAKIDRMGDLVVNETVISFQPPIQEASDLPEIKEEHEKDDNSESTEKFEQISIFGDDDFD